MRRLRKVAELRNIGDKMATEIEIQLALDFSSTKPHDTVS